MDNRDSQQAFAAAERETQPTGTAETLGKVGTDIGMTLATGGPVRVAGQTAVKIAAPALTRFVGRKAADVVPRMATEAAAGGASSYVQGGDPTTGAVPSGAIPVLGAGARAGVNAVLGGVRHTPAEAAAVQFAQANGIPLDAATATGRKIVEIVQKRASDSLGGAGVAEAAQSAQEAALKRTGERLAKRVHPRPITPEQAGSGVKQAVETVISRYAKAADEAYDTLRQIEADPSSLRSVTMKVAKTDASGVTKMVDEIVQMPLPVNLKKVKAMLKPVYRPDESADGADDS